MNEAVAGGFSVRFWGVRGSFPVPGPTTIRYGGNTACIEIRAGTERVMVDCGSGAHSLGNALSAEGCRAVSVLFTHTHLDHICGLPFFVPSYRADVDVHFFAGHLDGETTIRDVFRTFMDPTLFPVQPSIFRACTFTDFAPGDTLELPNGLIARTLLLNHPGNSIGYRIEWRGRSVSVITDHEHGNREIDDAIVEFVAGTEVMIYDAMFTEEEYADFVGWGHSTWEKALQIAERAGVHRPVTFHHAPHREDEALDAIRAAMRDLMANAEPAAEGMTIAIETD